jgi:hypothetical protein
MSMFCSATFLSSSIAVQEAFACAVAVAELSKDLESEKTRRASLSLGVAHAQSATVLARAYPVELAEMKRILEAAGARLPANRFDALDAELMRYAAAAGLGKVFFYT